MVPSTGLIEAQNIDLDAQGNWRLSRGFDWHTGCTGLPFDGMDVYTNGTTFAPAMVVAQGGLIKVSASASLDLSAPTILNDTLTSGYQAMFAQQNKALFAVDGTSKVVEWGERAKTTYTTGTHSFATAGFRETHCFCMATVAAVPYIFMVGEDAGGRLMVARRALAGGAILTQVFVGVVIRACACVSDGTSLFLLSTSCAVGDPVIRSLPVTLVGALSGLYNAGGNWVGYDMTFFPSTGAATHLICTGSEGGTAQILQHIIGGATSDKFVAGTGAGQFGGPAGVVAGKDAAGVDRLYIGDRQGVTVPSRIQMFSGVPGAGTLASVFIGEFGNDMPTAMLPGTVGPFTVPVLPPYAYRMALDTNRRLFILEQMPFYYPAAAPSNPMYALQEYDFYGVPQTRWHQSGTIYDVACYADALYFKKGPLDPTIYVRTEGNNVATSSAASIALTTPTKPISPPEVTPYVNGGGLTSTLTEGLYYFKYAVATWENDRLVESPCSDSARYTVPAITLNDAFYINIRHALAGNMWTDKYRLYILSPETGGEWLLLAEVPFPANTATNVNVRVRAINYTETGLTAPGASIYYGHEGRPPQGVRTLAHYRNRMCYAKGNRLYLSALNDPRSVTESTEFDPNDVAVGGYIDVGGDEPITCLLATDTDLLVFKTNGLWRLTGDVGMEAFGLTRISDRIGTPNPWSACLTEAGPWWYDKRMAWTLINDVVTPVGTRARGKWVNVPIASEARLCAAYNPDRRYVEFVWADGSLASNGRLLRFWFDTGAWTEQWLRPSGRRRYIGAPATWAGMYALDGYGPLKNPVGVFKEDYGGWRIPEYGVAAQAITATLVTPQVTSDSARMMNLQRFHLSASSQPSTLPAAITVSTIVNGVTPTAIPAQAVNIIPDPRLPAGGASAEFYPPPYIDARSVGVKVVYTQIASVAGAHDTAVFIRIDLTVADGGAA
jgi:hypothetical protein